MSWLVHEGRGRLPEARAGHTLSAVGSKLFLFGGFSGSLYLNDIFVFDTDSETWSRPAVSGVAPVARVSHSTTVVGKKLYIFGGTDGSGYRNDLCCLDTDDMTWSRPPTKGKMPEARAYHTCVTHANKLFIFGGFNGIQYLNDVFMLDLETFTWSKPKVRGMAPPPREGHTADVIDGKMYVFGGQSGKRSLNDLYVLNLDTMGWYGVAIITEETPCARFFHSSASYGTLIVVFGGDDGRNGVLNDLHVLDTENLSWARFAGLEGAPLERSAHASSVVGGRFHVLAGHDGYRCLADLSSVDIRSITLRKDRDTVRKGSTSNLSGVRQPLTLKNFNMSMSSGEVPIADGVAPLVSPRLVVKWLGGGASDAQRQQFAEIMSSLSAYRQAEKLGTSADSPRAAPDAAKVQELAQLIKNVTAALGVGPTSAPVPRPSSAKRRKSPRTGGEVPELPPDEEARVRSAAAGLGLGGPATRSVEALLRSEVAAIRQEEARRYEALRSQVERLVAAAHGVHVDPEKLQSTVDSMLSDDAAASTGAGVGRAAPPRPPREERPERGSEARMSRSKSKLLTTLEDALVLMSAEYDPVTGVPRVAPGGEAEGAKEKRLGFLQTVIEQVKEIVPPPGALAATPAPAGPRKEPAGASSLKAPHPAAGVGSPSAPSQAYSLGTSSSSSSAPSGGAAPRPKPKLLLPSNGSVDIELGRA
eukprot:tig00000241_g20913.t1